MVEKAVGPNAVEQKTISKARGRWKLFAVLAVCASPLLASYFTYYVLKPSARNNYGTLIDPRTVPMPAMATRTLAGDPVTLESLSGKWIMLKAGGSDCRQACQDQLFTMRQLRTMQGRERERIERVWLITDEEPLETMLLRVNDGTRMLRAPKDIVYKWLPVEAGGNAQEHIYIIDPRGNLMMRFPKNPDPAKMKKDIGKLLKASAIG
ncbi:SCO family protein [Pseudoduganella albidiflava]|uniref:Cytochrome C oxidase subunit I n=1 Tax=Pseudoduganella albidiflava TaxID=321983 RepID=A0A411X3U5_9BURK|nr:cytochrome C oxidase subunit I [Pseudoduganella albidiflava]GGY50891.1 cytochrome c oxidase subunit I [Pseudoduganella albidiflava]